MPCSDVTEILRLTIDAQNRVIFYSLSKRTCGASVGNPSLLRKWIANRRVPDVMSATPGDVLAALPKRSRIWEFLSMKHLLAIKCGLAALLGDAPARPDDACTIASVSFGPEGVKMEADVKVDILTSRIRACGACGSCGEKASIN